MTSHESYDYLKSLATVCLEAWSPGLTTKETSQLRITGPFVRESTGDQLFPITKGQLCRDHDYIMDVRSTDQYKALYVLGDPIIFDDREDIILFHLVIIIKTEVWAFSLSSYLSDVTCLGWLYLHICQVVDINMRKAKVLFHWYCSVYVVSQW